MILPSLPSSPTALFRCYLIPSKRTQTRTSVRGAFNLYFIAVGTNVFQSGDPRLLFPSTSGVRQPFSRCTDQGIILPRFQTMICVFWDHSCVPQEKEQKGVLLMTNSLSNVVGVVFLDFRQPLHGYCCVYGIHPFEVTNWSPKCHDT